MLYTAKDVKTACNRTLAETFPDVKIYGTDTLDGYERPSFFTELTSRGRERESRYLARFGYRYRITYFERTHDEAHCMDVLSKIMGAFEPYIILSNDRHNRLFVEDVDWQFIDENADKLQVTIDFYSMVELGGYVPETADVADGMGLETVIKRHYENDLDEIKEG